MAATEVLKCQRPWKSSVMRWMVWCSLRRTLRGSGASVGDVVVARVAGREANRVLGDEAVEAREETVDALHSLVLPVEVAIRRGGKQRVETRGIGAVAGHHVIGRDDVAQRLGHLGAVLDDHALGEQALRGLVVVDEADVAHELGPEARVHQVQNGVLDAADVLIHGEPVVGDFADQTARCRWGWCSGKNTSSNRRRCPWCRIRGGRCLRTWDTDTS